MLKRLRAQSVSRLLIQVTIVSALLPMLLIGARLYQAAWDNSWREIREKHQLLAQNLAAPIATYVKGQRNLLIQLASSMTLLTRQQPAKVETLLAQTLASISGFRSLAVLDVNGKTLALAETQPMQHADTGILSKEACFLETRASGKPSLSKVKRNPFNGQPAIYMGQPVMDQKGKLRAVILGELDIAYIEQLRSHIRFGERGHAAIVDKTGHVIAHPNAKWMEEIKDISDWSIVQKMLAGDTGVTSFYSPFMKDNMLAGYAAVPEVGWGIMVPQPESEVAAQVNALLHSYLLWGISGFVLVLVLMLYLARWITRPLDELAHAGQDLMSRNLVGNLPDVKADAPRELRQLGHVMQNLIRNLQSSRDEVSRFNATLQSRVEEATTRLRDSNRKLEEMARSDHLTALANRRYFEASLMQTLSRRSNDIDNVCVMLIDIDHFKHINDAYGHAAGDAVLNHIARILERSMRSGDLVARYGGDEFVAYMRCTHEIGLERATHVRELIAQSAIPWQKRTLQITASIGLYCQVLVPGTDVAQVLDRADDAMYEAKKLGRNRVVDITH